MNNNLISVLKNQSLITESKLNEAVGDVSKTKLTVTESPTIPGLNFRVGNNRNIGNVSEIIEKRKFISNNLKSIPHFHLPKDLFFKLLKATRLVLLYPTINNTYLIPNRWRSEQSRVRNNTRQYGKTPIRRIDLRQAYPNGIIRNERVPTEFDDRVKVTIPLPPKDIQKNMFEALGYIPKSNNIEVCTLADPRCLGTELTLRKEPKPRPRPSRAIDPGLVVVSEFFATILPKTFYHLSDMERGFLIRAEGLLEKWDAHKFIMN